MSISEENSRLIRLPAQKLSTFITSEAVLRVADEFGMVEPSLSDLIEAHKTAAALIDENIAAPEDYVRCKEKSGVCALVFKEDGKITGMIALLMLNEIGVEAVVSGDFDARNPDSSHLCNEGEPVFSGYGWGVTATTKNGARASLACADKLYRTLFNEVPCFARAVTADGVRVMTTSLGHTPVPWEDDGLVWRQAQILPEAA